MEQNPSLAAQLRTGPQIITVASGKGGVGKTHFSVNLATKLVEMKYRVLLIDGDLGLANVNVLLGVSPERNASHLLNGTHSFEDVLTRVNGLDILPAGTALAQLSELDISSQVRLLKTLDLANRPYDFVIIDSAAGIGGNVRLAVSLAHEVLVMMNPEITSLTDAYALVKVSRAANRATNFRVLVNNVKMAEQAREMFTSINKAARTFLNFSLEFAGYIYRDNAVEKALRSQKPFVELFPETPAARCVENLAKKLSEGLESAFVENRIH